MSHKKQIYLVLNHFSIVGIYKEIEFLQLGVWIW